MMPNKEHLGADDQVLRLVEEQATVRKEVVDTSRVSVSTHLNERTETIHEALRHEDVIIDRVPINRVIDEAPSVRQEGDVTVYPIVEEELVITKRLILKEELRISRKIRIEPIERDVTLRAMSATVERTAAQNLSPELPTPRTGT